MKLVKIVMNQMAISKKTNRGCTYIGIVKYTILVCCVFLTSCNEVKTENKTKEHLEHALSSNEIFEMLNTCTVTLLTDESQGSGFFIDSNTIVTNYHVVENASFVKFKTELSDSFYNVLGYVGVDKLNDLILLRTNYISNNAIQMDGGKVNIGDKIYSLSTPIGLPNTFSDGMISARRNFDGIQLLQITAPISHGSSGSPIVNQYGKAIGVAVGGIDEGSNLGFCIPVKEVLGLREFAKNYATKFENSTVTDNNTKSKSSKDEVSKSVNKESKISNTQEKNNELNNHEMSCLNLDASKIAYYQLTEICFPIGGSIVLNKSELRNISDFLIQVDKKVVIACHTDHVGSPCANKKLTQKRADNLKNNFIEYGVSSSKIIAVGCGEVFPIESNETIIGRKKNRRIELFFINMKEESENDWDGDGFNNEDDKCPKIQGTVNRLGCPEITDGC
ncbi:MAG: trypsin-like peptidase domain-containing protein [Bacteroidetes bacterium]|nr:trypsin-like peptidase domain-containing protein [Bacteroidota bacterium]